MNDQPRSANVRRLLIGVGLALAVIAIAWMVFAPEPVAVEVANAGRGPMEVTVDQEGEVRVHDRYQITAPVAGQLLRVDVRDGDPVVAGQVVAELDPSPMDARERQEAVARVDAARARVREASRLLESSRAELVHAEADLKRAERLVAEKFISPEALDNARTEALTKRAAVDAARAREEAARYDARVAEAALVAMPAAGAKPGTRIALKSPVAGRVLRVLEQSERTVPAGTVVMSIGDPARFEIVADVLSTDAVKVRSGMQARLEEWGGDRSLRAVVRLVEPYAFTKVSSLGIEEQRVNVLMDPIDPLGPLGDGYRVEARIVIWSAPDVLKVPASALFRHGRDWAVFVVAGGHAERRLVTVGQRNAREAEIREGLQAGEQVVIYPGNQLADGARVTVREARR